MSDTIEYRPLPIDIDDLLRLKAAVGDRERELPAASQQQLTRRHTDAGDAYIAVEIKGVSAIFHISRAVETETEAAKPCWLVYPPSAGSLFEFPAVVDVANYVALGDGRMCKRSYGTGWSEPGLIVGGALVGAPGGPNGAPPRPAAKVREEIVTDAQGLRARRRIEA